MAFVIISVALPKYKYSAMSMDLLMMMLMIIALSNFNLTQGIALLKQMFRYHRLAYYDHRKALIALLLTTWISMFMQFAICLSGFWLAYCLAAEHEFNDEPENSAFLGEGGFCHAFIYGFFDVLISPKNYQYLSCIYLSLVMLQVIPLLAFYTFDRPHDCFVCLGKDPDRIYSKL